MIHGFGFAVFGGTLTGQHGWMFWIPDVVCRHGLASSTKHHVSCDDQSVGAAAIRERQAEMGTSGAPSWEFHLMASAALAARRPNLGIVSPCPPQRRPPCPLYTR